MKKFFLTLAVVTLVIGVTGIANVYALNITRYDEVSTWEPWHQAGEDEEVEPGMSHGQQWDLERFFYDPDTALLTMVGGFDFWNGVTDTAGNHWDSGDIFIDVDGDAVYGPPADGSDPSVGNNPVSNSFGYDYVLDMDFASNTFNVFALTEQSMVISTYFTQNQEANPWRFLQQQEVALGTGDIMSTLPPDPEDGAEIGGLLGDTHYIVDVDLGWLVGMPNYSGSFTAHFTMQCGNDNLIGHYDPIPEPGTLLLLGAGLIGLLALGRKR